MNSAKLVLFVSDTVGPGDYRGITMSILDLSQLPVKNWFPVGLELGVEMRKLDRITEQAHKEEECVVLMFDDWLRNHAREACYPPMKLVAVLLDAGEMESARMVCEQYGKSSFFTA